jgi:hypothetical protein
MIGLISCSSQKLDRPAIARSLYSSPLFQKSLAYAERRCMAVYVLSAAHGLVGVDDFVQPYNRRLGTKQERFLWAKSTVASLQGKHEGYEELLVLAGEDYAQPLRRALHDVNWIGEVHEPLHGRQVGERLSWLNAEIARMPLQLPPANDSPADRAVAQWMTPRPASGCACACNACVDCAHHEHKTLACSFCGKSEHDVKRMVSGPRAFICDGCVGLCCDILNAQSEAA